MELLIMGDAVREEARRRGLSITPSNLRELARKLREEEGPLAIAKRIEKKVADCLEKSCIVLVDGARSLDEVNYFRKYGEVIIVAIEAPLDVRLERIIKRGREDDPKRLEELEKREQVEFEMGLGKLVKKADLVIENVGSIVEYKEKVGRLLREIERSCA
jgi:dephospho-CoA kinase